MKPVCVCGHEVIARGMCLKCYDADRSFKRRQRHHVGSPQRKGRALSSVEIAELLRAWPVV